jgi:hypothetical protein
MEVTGRRGRRCRKLLHNLKERRGYSHLKKEALDRTMWRACFGRGFRPVVRQTANWMNYNIVILWDHRRYAVRRYAAHDCVWQCPNGRLFNRGDKKSRGMFHFKGDTIVTWRLFVQMKHKEIYGSERRADNRSILILCNKRPLLVIVRSCANVLATVLPNDASPSNNTRSYVKYPIFLPNINPILIFSIDL